MGQSGVCVCVSLCHQLTDVFLPSILPIADTHGCFLTSHILQGREEEERILFLFDYGEN